MRFKALVRKFYQRYLLDAMSAMALGLFASLIIGLILTQLSMIPALNFLASYGEIVSASSPVVGAAIGVAIAYGLKVAPLAHVFLRPPRARSAISSAAQWGLFRRRGRRGTGQSRGGENQGGHHRRAHRLHRLRLLHRHLVGPGHQ